MHSRELSHRHCQQWQELAKRWVLFLALESKNNVGVAKQNTLVHLTTGVLLAECLQLS